MHIGLARVSAKRESANEKLTRRENVSQESARSSADSKLFHGLVDSLHERIALVLNLVSVGHHEDDSACTPMRFTLGQHLYGIEGNRTIESVTRRPRVATSRRLSEKGELTCGYA